MTLLTSPQLAKIRNKNQYTELYIAKYEPHIIFSAKINNASITKGARIIDYDTVTFSIPSMLKSGMTMYLSSPDKPGFADVGRVRYISIDTGTSQITVAQDNNIQYGDNDYLYIKDFHEFWPKFPRITVDTGTLTATIYKDYDIVLSDQNTNFEPVVIMGPNFAGFYDAFPQIWFTATGSYTVDGSTITGYQWEFPTGCTPTLVNSGTAGYITFPEAGMYTVICTVTASNGKTATGYRHIALLDRYNKDHDHGQVFMPLTDSSFVSLDGEWGSGYILKIKIRDKAYRFAYGDLVIVFTEDYYDFDKVSYGGYPGREHILFCGYVTEIKTNFDAFDSDSEMTIKGIAPYMVNKEMFSIEMFDTPDTPADWTQIQNMTINKMIHHFFRWHTTLLSMTDFIHITTGEGDYRDNWVQIAKGEISNIIGDFLKNRVLGAFSSDRQGVARAEVDVQVILTGSRPSSVMTFNDADWVGEPVIQERIEQPIADVLLGGQAYDPPTYTGTAFLSRAPGELQTYNGKSENVSGLSLTSQDNANELAGLYYAKVNNLFPELIFELANNMRNIDITPQELYNYTIPGLQTHRFIFDTNFRLLPRKISYKLDNFVLKGTVAFEPETSGPPGDTIIIPVDVVDGPTRCEEFPEDCEPPCGGDCGTPCVNCEGDGNTVYVWTATHIGRTRNFLASSPNWTAVDSGISGTILDGILDPYDPSNSAYTLTDAGIYHTSNLADTSPVWTLKKTRAQMLTAMGSKWLNNSNTKFNNVSATIAQEDVLWISVSAQGSYDNDSNGVGESRAIGAIHTTDGFGTIDGKLAAGPQFSGGTIHSYIQASNRLASTAFIVGLIGDPQSVYKTTNSNSSWTSEGAPGAAFSVYDWSIEFAYAGSSPTLTEKVRYVIRDLNNIYKSSDYGGSYSLVKTVSGISNAGTTDDTFCKNMNVATWDENDVLIMIPNSSGGSGAGAKLLRSTDGASSWVYETFHSGNDWRDAKSLGRWPYNPERCFILWGSATGPGYSTDGGVNWSNKRGDWNSAIATFDSPISIVPLWIEA